MASTPPRRAGRRFSSPAPAGGAVVRPCGAAGPTGASCARSARLPAAPRRVRHRAQGRRRPPRKKAGGRRLARRRAAPKQASKGGLAPPWTPQASAKRRRHQGAHQAGARPAAHRWHPGRCQSCRPIARSVLAPRPVSRPARRLSDQRRQPRFAPQARPAQAGRRLTPQIRSRSLPKSPRRAVRPAPLPTQPTSGPGKASRHKQARGARRPPWTPARPAYCGARADAARLSSASGHGRGRHRPGGSGTLLHTVT